MNRLRGEGLDVTIFAAVTDDEIKFSLRLSADSRIDETTRAPLRVVCLIDISGSMLHYSNRRSSVTKIQVVRNFCRLLVGVLGRGDGLAVVTFGERANILVNMCRIDRESEMTRHVLTAIDDIKCSGTATDISSGLSAAFRLLATDKRCTPTYDTIVILSDGDINSGIIDTVGTKRFVRDHINQYGGVVSVAIVKTGGSISEAMVSLSDYFGSHPYVYLDGRSATPEIGMILPVISRQLSSAFNVSLSITAHNGVRIDWKNCNQTYLRRNYKQTYPTQIHMRIYDVGHMTSRHVGLILVQGMNYKDLIASSVILDILIEYTDERFVSRTLTISLTKGDIEKRIYAPRLAIIADDIRRVVAKMLASASDSMEVGDTENCSRILLECQNEMAAMKGDIANKERLGKASGVLDFIELINDRLADLKRSVDRSPQGPGHRWNKIVALKSAIEREMLGLSEAVEVMLTKQGAQDEEEELDLSDSDCKSKCTNVIVQVASMLGALTNTVYKSQTLPRLRSQENNDEVTAGLSRTQTAKRRIRMTQDLENLLQYARDDVTDGATPQGGQEQTLGRNKYDDMIDELGNILTLEKEKSKTVNSSKPTTSRSNSYENWVADKSGVASVSNSGKKVLRKYENCSKQLSGERHNSTEARELELNTSSVLHGATKLKNSPQARTNYAQIVPLNLNKTSLEEKTNNGTETTSFRPCAKNRGLNYINVEVVKKEPRQHVQLPEN